MFRILDGLGTCYFHLNNYVQGENFIQKALHVEGLSDIEKSRGLCDLGILKLELNNFEGAKSLFIESLNIRRELHLEDAASTCLIHLGECYLKMDKLDEVLKLKLTGNNTQV